ncbi:hypothetical protein C8Q80DRAFT_395020 [Daedaleopsis nitida]|nr:hypothetical protein C8Q80DRAFT_395020 [Daedaleopsis nitida]
MQLSPTLSTHDIGDAFEGDDRPRKRRRTLDYTPTCQQIALEEIDLEISMRQRIADVVQTRLAWAQLLQQSLQSSANGSSGLRTASLDALEAIEEPCKLIFCHESRLAQPLPRLQPAIPLPSSIDIEQVTRTSARSTRTGGRAKPPPAPRKRLLFLRDSMTNPPEIAKLVCFVCQRSDFSSLQGLLNHCRLSHQLEVGTHDECVQRCAVLVPEEERELVFSTGIELKGISLPSLRRLFELAVGAGENGQLPPLPAKAQPSTIKAETTEQILSPRPESVAEDSPQDEVVRQGTHVTRTLGYHIDTPALAPFLGRAPKNRRINVATEQDEDVVIEDLSAGSGLLSGSGWRKPYVHRNVARREVDEVLPLSDLPAPSANNQAAQTDGNAGGQLPGTRMSSGTRFHIAARVQVADYSVVIPPNRRSSARPDHTHCWRLAVTSPSYSLPISTVLSKITVASVTDPPPSTLAEPVVIDEPPFIVTSTTDRPFLARLTFIWAGSMNPPTEVDHWVELDPMLRASAVLGDEQVFDVELDRHTELLPVREDVRKVSWEDAHVPEATRTEKAAEEEEEPEPDYALKLRSLLPQYPMIMKGRFNARLPYTLVSTPAQLRSLPYGRRKAIEMGRARALRDAYTELVAQSHDLEALPLTIVDVFHWLEDENLFLRASVSTPGTTHQQRRKSSGSSRKPLESEDSRSTDYCRACGLQRAYHPTLTEDDKTLDVKNSLSTPAPSLGVVSHRARSSCVTFHDHDDDDTARPPIVEARTLLGDVDEPDRAGSVPNGFHPSIYTPRSSSPSNEVLSLSTTDLVAVADPRLVVAILRLTGLPTARVPAARVRTDADVSYETSSPERESRTVYLRALTTGAVISGLSAQPRAIVDAQLAPSAALSIALKAFIRQLVVRGVEMLRQDETALRPASGRHRHERARRAMASGPQRILTPTHVLAGVSRHAATDVTGSALFLSMARLVETSRPPSNSDDPSTSGDSRRILTARDIHLDAGQMTALSGGRWIQPSGDGKGGEGSCVEDTAAETRDRELEAPGVLVKIEEREM